MTNCDCNNTNPMLADEPKKTCFTPIQLGIAAAGTGIATLVIMTIVDTVKGKKKGSK